MELMTNVKGSPKLLQFILREDKNVCTKCHDNSFNVYNTHFTKKTTWWRQRRHQGITKVRRIHPVGTLFRFFFFFSLLFIYMYKTINI